MTPANIADIPGEGFEIAVGRIEFRPIVNEREVRANVVYISPGAEVYGMDHKHDDYEMLYVISGGGIIYDAKGATPFTSGDTVFFEPNEPHWFVMGDAGAEVLELKWM